MKDLDAIRNSGKLTGVVACGGRSLRMGTDKGLLEYFGEPQRYRIYKMLLPYCQSVCLSVNKGQLQGVNERYHVITDMEKYEEIGPMASVLTAFNTFPGSDLLVVGCDYPFISEQEIARFLKNIPGDSHVAAFYNEEKKYEPLLAWYSKECATSLFEEFENGNHSLQRFLRKHHAQKYVPKDPKTMISADRPEQYEQIRAITKA